MKFDEKTGNKIPENRRDEVQLTIEELNKMRKETNGMSSRTNEICLMLGDVSVSLAILIDILSAFFNMMAKVYTQPFEHDHKPDESPDNK